MREGVLTRSLRGQLGWYAGGTVAAAGFSTLLFLAYARFLPPDQLGALVLTQATVAILRILGTAGAPLGMFRYVAGPPEDLAGRSPVGLITTTLAFGLVSSTVLGIAALAFASPILGSLPGHDPQQLVALAGLTAAASAPREIAELVLRAQGRAATWSIYVAASSALLVGCAAVAVTAVTPTAETILTFQLAGLIAVSLVGAVLIRSVLAPRRISLGDLRPLLRLGIPYDATVLLDWILRYVDRFILLAFVSASDIGVYSFGSRIGQLVQQLGGAAATAAWEPYSLGQYRRPGAAIALGRTSTLLLVGVLTVAVAVGAAAEPLVRAAGGRIEYVAGAAFAFPIGLACWLGTARGILLTPLALRLRPELTLVALLAAAMSTVLLDLMLIPIYGIWGAAVATVAGYAVGAAAGLLLGKRAGMISFEPRKLALAVALATIAYVTSALVNVPSDLAALFARPLLALAIFVAMLFALRVVPVPAALARRTART